MHHENWDGSGYPDGMKGEEIPLLGRIVSVADAFDAMTTDRPYSKAMTSRRRWAGCVSWPEEVRRRLRRRHREGRVAERGSHPSRQGAIASRKDGGRASGRGGRALARLER